MTHRFPALIGIGATIVAVTVAAIACGGPTPTGSAGGTAAGHGTAGPASATSPTPEPQSGHPKPSGPGSASCAEGSRQLTIDPAAPPPLLCLRIGETLYLSTPASPLQPWQPFMSSDPQVLECRGGNGAEGTVAAVCTARRAGQAAVTTQTGPFSGDPHGPAQQSWHLTVQVTG